MTGNDDADLSWLFSPGEEEAQVWAAVERIKASPYEPDEENENDPSDTLLYRAARELTATAIERGCDIHMFLDFILMDLHHYADEVRERRRNGDLG